jgi:signal transduction histidine kinase
VRAESIHQPDACGFDDVVESLHRQVSELQQRVEHHERLAHLGTMAAALAHEFNNVLTPAAAWAKLGQTAMDQDPPDLDRVRHALAKCASASGRAQRLSQTVLGAAGTKTVDEVADAEAACRLACEDLDLDEPNLDVRTDAQVPMSPTALRHVFVNLFANARPHRVCIERSAGELQVHVEDRAGGVPDDLRGSIFDPFVSGRSGGHGLGLCLCRQLVRRAGGSIRLRTRPGVGSTFTLAWRKASSRASAAA